MTYDLFCEAVTHTKWEAFLCFKGLVPALSALKEVLQFRAHYTVKHMRWISPTWTGIKPDGWPIGASNAVTLLELEGKICTGCHIQFVTHATENSWSCT